MNVKNSPIIPTSAAANAARNNAARGTASALSEGHTLAATHGPAATVEISPAARRASSEGPGQAPVQGSRPLNIIWGDSPRWISSAS